MFFKKEKKKKRFILNPNGWFAPKPKSSFNDDFEIKPIREINTQDSSNLNYLMGPKKESDFEKLIIKLINDKKFLKEFKNDPYLAIKSLGLIITKEEVEKLCAYDLNLRLRVEVLDDRIKRRSDDLI